LCTCPDNAMLKSTKYNILHMKVMQPLLNVHVGAFVLWLLCWRSIGMCLGLQGQV
jgi:hypothetical protein